MSSHMFDGLEEAAGRLREQGERIRAFQADLATRTTTVVSKNRMVSATVGGAGRLTGLVFKGSRYRSIPPAELASLVMETVNAALEKASAEALGAAQGLLPAGAEWSGASVDGFDVESFLTSTFERMGESLSSWRGGQAEGGA